ncbi:hypothetical protein [Spirillospora sp. NPDC047279]|uniref:hypothetical protein n=1 Tax=Spirillospora sp. NPDC047279 TaxID=3155478 RepID=UPI0033F3A72E
MNSLAEQYRLTSDHVEVALPRALQLVERLTAEGVHAYLHHRDSATPEVAVGAYVFNDTQRIGRWVFAWPRLHTQELYWHHARLLLARRYFQEARPVDHVEAMARDICAGLAARRRPSAGY